MMIKKYFKLHLWMVLIVPVLFITSCQKDLEESEVDSISATEYDSEVPFKWNELLIEIDRYSPNYRPPAAARMMGYIGLAVYEGVVPGMADYKSLKSEFVGLSLPSIE